MRQVFEPQELADRFRTPEPRFFQLTNPVAELDERSEGWNRKAAQ
jgi:hypothetical protein